MKNTILAVGFLGIALSANAVSYSDADFFGSLSLAGLPSGIHMVTGTGTATVNGSFDFKNSDSTGGFNIGAPYLIPVRGTYTSATGFQPGVEEVTSGTIVVQLFFRDPSGGAETISFSADDLVAGAVNIVTAKAITLTGGESLTVDADINADGVLNYTVKSLGSAGQEFWFDAAYAGVDTQLIPDGGATLGMLGLAFLGLAGVRRGLK